MARPRKLLDNSTGDLTVARKMQKMREEERVSGLPRDLLEEPPKELRDKYAVTTWERLVPDLKKLPTTCNLDRDNLICYCNAWSEYMESGRRLKRNKQDMLYQKLWHLRRRDAMEDMRTYGRLCGMTLDSRLKSATIGERESEDAIELKYGMI